MAIMLSKTYAAFKAAGVPDAQAQAASEEIAGYETRLTSIEARLLILTWMTGGIYAALTIFGVPSLWLLLRVAAKVGALG
jgi:hypothetical protein